MKDFFGVVLGSALAAGLAVVLFGLLLVPLHAGAANNVGAAALKKATADCRGQVKAYAQYNEASWWARHQMLKKCIADPNHVCRQC
jgi:hypothetical protein